jgi:hypothetical protein
MVVATIALAVAMTGTAFAAEVALVPGSHIKPHSITAKQLADGAVTHKVLARQAVLGNNVGGAVPGKYVPQTCPDGSTVVDAPCPVQTYVGVTGALAGTRITVPAGAGVLTNYFSRVAGTSTAMLNSAPAVMIMPNKPMRISKLVVGIVGDPASNWPTMVTVALLVNGSASVVNCSITVTSGGANRCSMRDEIILAPKSTVAFEIGVSGFVPPPGVPGAWDSFDLSVGYLSQVWCTQAKNVPCPIGNARGR